MKVLAVSLRKGGVGKTLFSVLLAQYFGHIAKQPWRTLLIDLDTQQNASECLIDMEVDEEAPDHKIVPIHPEYDPNDPEQADWDGRSSSADIFLGDPSEVIIAPYPTRFKHLEVLPAAGAALQAVELVRTEEVKRYIYDRLKAFFSDPDVQENYDLIIIDTPPGKGAINRSVLRSATHVLYPVVPEEKPINGLRGMIQFERMERRHREKPIEVIGVVPNMVNLQTRLHRENLEILRQDPMIAPMMADFTIGEHIAFPMINKPGVEPETIWELKNYPEAHKETFQLCEYVEQRLFGQEEQNNGLARKCKKGSGSPAGKAPSSESNSRLSTDRIAYYTDRESDVLNFDFVRLEQIELDPTNPRTRGIDPLPLLEVIPKFLVIDPNHPQYDAAAVAEFDTRMQAAVDQLIDQAGEKGSRLREFFDRLLPLRDNIRILGVKQPIEIRPTGKKDRYRIVYGHRRYLAAILAGERSILARLVSDTAPLKTVQVAENLHQDALTLHQRLEAIEQLLEELGIDAGTPARKVCTLTGHERSTMSRYLTILKSGSRVLRQAISDGAVDNLRAAVKIARLPEDAQAEAIRKIRAGEALESETSRKESAVEGEGSTSRRRGRKRSAITTPKIKNPRIVKTLLERLDLPEACEEIDWDDIEQAHNAWNRAFERLIQKIEA